MKQPDFPDVTNWQLAGSGWFQALNLVERLPLPTGFKEIFGSEIAERKLRRWQEQAPFNKENYFNERLQADGLDTVSLLYLLDEPGEALQARTPDISHWLQELETPYSAPGKEWPRVLGLHNPEKQDIATLIEPLKPLIIQALEQLEVGIHRLSQEYDYLPFDTEKVTGLLFESLTSRLVPKISRTFALEVNVARVQGRLRGETSQARFQDFIRQLSQESKILPLLEEYPVLARQLVIAINQWTRYELEFLRHLCADWSEVSRIFCPQQAPGELVEVKGGKGDSHRGGRSVLKLKFSSGFQLIYKPRSMAIDLHFQELLVWLNQRGANPPFRPLAVLDRGSYGWVEYVEAGNCATSAEVARFYERQGAYLALLYALEATDLHLENLIASGEHPVIVDLEALFHPRLKGWELDQEGISTDQTMNYSVLRLGMLPSRIYGIKGSESVDFSALGGKGGQLTLKPVLKWEALGTDQMHLTQERMLLAGSDNLPRMNKEEVNVSDYSESLLAGFERLYRLLVTYRDELITEVLPRFDGDEIRVILRHTQNYAKILQESFHPDLLRNGLDRQRFLDNLWAIVEKKPYMRRVIPVEQFDLDQGDIPMFTTTPASRHIFDSQGRQIEDFLPEPGLEAVTKRLYQLGEEDLHWQQWFIQASLATLVVSNPYTVRQPLAVPENPGAAKAVSQPELLDAACAVGNRLAELALSSGDKLGWVGLSQMEERHWMISSAGIDLYSGTPGIILFLAYLGAVTEESRYTALAKAALPMLREQTAWLRPRRDIQIGAFDGISGLIYVYSHLGRLWGEPALFEEASELVKLLPDLLKKDQFMDIIGGAAGCILSLLSFYRVMPAAATLNTALECGEFLLAQARPMSRGLAWPNPLGIALAGFSHGVAGIAYSLLELASVSGEARYRRAALAGLEFERSLFSVEHQNWPDLRERDKLRYAATWCHGAGGIALGRLAIQKHFNDTALRDEVKIALRTTVREGFGINHSLCHGDLGNLDPLLVATLTLGDLQYRDQLNYVSRAVLQSIKREGWLSGSPLAVESPGLMSGLAGIGYGLLRLAEPSIVPSVLLLSPPV